MECSDECIAVPEGFKNEVFSSFDPRRFRVCNACGKKLAQLRSMLDGPSECVNAYAGAVTRYGRYTGGKIGIHQPYFEVPKDELSPVSFRNSTPPCSANCEPTSVR